MLPRDRSFARDIGIQWFRAIALVFDCGFLIATSATTAATATATTAPRGLIIPRLIGILRATWRRFIVAEFIVVLQIFTDNISRTIIVSRSFSTLGPVIGIVPTEVVDHPLGLPPAAPLAAQLLTRRVAKHGVEGCVWIQLRLVEYGQFLLGRGGSNCARRAERRLGPPGFGLERFGL